VSLSDQGNNRFTDAEGKEQRNAHHVPYLSPSLLCLLTPQLSRLSPLTSVKLF